MSLNLTQKWLKQVLGPYPQKDQIYNDVDATLAAYPTLRPKNDVYSKHRVEVASVDTHLYCQPSTMAEPSFYFASMA
jgi:hypothetical protein